MRQRLGIADALVKSPDLLILDEPTTSIDPLGVVEILDLLRRLIDERGLAIMLSSHLLIAGPVGLRPDRHLRERAAGRHRHGRGAGRDVRRRDGRHRGRSRAPDAGRRRARRDDTGAACRRSSRSSRRRDPTARWRVHVRPADEEGARPPGDPPRGGRTGPAADRAAAGRAVARRHLPDRRRAAARRSRGVKRKGRRRRGDGAAASATEAATERPTPTRSRHRATVEDRPRPTEPPRTRHEHRRPAGPPELRVPHAGWRVIAAKEFGDHLLSVRFLVLLVVLGLAAAIPLYFAADRIRAAAPQASGSPAVFLALFTLGSQDFDLPAGRRRSSAWSRRCSGWRSRSTPSTASAPMARCRVCSPSRSIATTSSTASSPPGWPSSRLVLVAVIVFIAGFGMLRLGIVPHGVRRSLRLAGVGPRHVRVRRRCGCRSGCCCRSCSDGPRPRRSSVSGCGFCVSDVRGLITTIVTGVPVAGRRRERRHGRSARRRLQQFISRLMPSTLYAEISAVILNPSGPRSARRRRSARSSRASSDRHAARPSTRACSSSGRRSWPWSA